LWLDLNEPASFGTNEPKPWYFDDPEHANITPLMCPLNGTEARFDIPPYETYNAYFYRFHLTKAYLSSETLCMLAISSSGRMYDVKNLYGLYHSIATQKALQSSTSKRGILISRSSYPSGGHYAGHSLGDNRGSWSAMRTSVIGIQQFNMFGIPYVGADICGYYDNVTVELCLRWHQLGAFYPLMR
uniref:Sucrase-isomaltase, intestinal n=1 Tax=Ascaris lumbricoides TaxID=6252 RepID=A0A0M3IMP0_ASCLU